MEYWNKRNAERTPQESSEYNKGRHRYLRSLITRTQGTVLKLDLWNEGGRKGVFDIGLFKTFDVIGMDISEVACTKARMEVPWLSLTNSTVEMLPFRYESIDVILDISTSDHIPYKAFCRVVGDYARILRERGDLLMIFNNRLPGTPRLTDVADYWFTTSEVAEAVTKHFNLELLNAYGTPPNTEKHVLLKAVKKE